MRRIGPTTAAVHNIQSVYVCVCVCAAGVVVGECMQCVSVLVCECGWYRFLQSQ